MFECGIGHVQPFEQSFLSNLSLSNFAVPECIDKCEAFIEFPIT